MNNNSRYTLYSLVGMMGSTTLVIQFTNKAYLIIIMMVLGGTIGLLIAELKRREVEGTRWSS